MTAANSSPRRAVRRRLRGIARRRLRWVPATPPAGAHQGWPGAVDAFDATLVAGWVAVPPGTAPVRIGLHVGRLEIATAWAREAAPPDPQAEAAGDLQVRPFRFKIRGIWRYVRRAHRITVRADGRPLPITGHGMFLRPQRNGRGTLAELGEKLAAGYVWSQSGSLQLSRRLDHTWVAELITLYESVRTVLRQAFDYDVFAIYGSLLGAVREGGVLGHDIDFDAAYVSRHSEPGAVVAEFEQIALRLIEAGLNVDCVYSTLYVRSATDPKIRLDLFHLYFDAAGILSFPFGVAGVRDVRKEEWQGVAPRAFGTAEVLAPVCAEAMVEAIYGPGWRKPDLGFSWALDRRTRAEDALAPRETLRRVYWANVHSRGVVPATPSLFGAGLAQRLDTPPVVLDLGSGNGRDAVAFGLSGRHVVGLDQCPVGLRQGRARAEQAGVEDRVTFRSCDLADADDLRPAVADVLARAGTEPVLFYARFLLHAVLAEVQDALLGEIAAAARPADMLAAEFRVGADEALPKVNTPRALRRRFQDGPAFGRRLAEVHGFEVVEEAEGTGLAPYESEDPVVYRVLARRRPAVDHPA